MSRSPIYEIPLTEIQGGCHRARVGSREMVILETSEGIRVYDGVCPHLGGPLLAGRASGRTLVCPWHGYAFDVVNGRCLTVPGRIWREEEDHARWKEPMSIALRPMRHEVREHVLRVFDE